MTTVYITVNNKTIAARSAHRRTAHWKKEDKECYLTDAGDLIYHNPDEGILKLAIKMLKTIKEV